MHLEPTPLAGLYVISPQLIQDERGFFMEVYRQDVLKEQGIEAQFVQSNHSRSVGPVLRGLHFQWNKPLGKLIRVINGAAYMAAVDIRPKSASFRQWFGGEFSAANKKLLWAPPGLATGFCVVGEAAEVEYQYTALYNQKGEGNILWNDPEFHIPWPIENPIISPRDAAAPTLAEWLKRPEAQMW